MGDAFPRTGVSLHQSSPNKIAKGLGGAEGGHLVN